MSAPLILACDTTQGACSVALYKQTLIGEKLTPMIKGHAEALIPMIEAVLSETGYAMADIDRLAVTHGPGTFTGTRVGLAAMRGLALALQKPLKAYGTLEAMAQNISGPLLVAVDARREVFYAQAFDGQSQPLTPPQALSAQAALALLDDRAFSIIGSGAAHLSAIGKNAGLHCAIGDGDIYPHAANVAALAHADANWEGTDMPSPLYLRPPDATLPNRAKFPERAQEAHIAADRLADMKAET